MHFYIHSDISLKRSH